MTKGATTMIRCIAGLLLALSLAAPAAAQTYLTSTTNSAAIAVNATSFAVASATGIAAGGGLYIDREYMSVRSVSGTTVTVLRGQGGTIQNAHGATRTVVIIPAAAIPTVVSATDPSQTTGVGACTAANHQYLPIINVTSGNVWLCRTLPGVTGTVWAGTNSAPLTYNSLLLNIS